MASAGVGGVDAKTGKLLWKFDRDHQITVPTPIATGDRVYVASGYSIGSTLLELTAVDKVKPVYSKRDMVNHHGGVILVGGHLYGYCDRNGAWICQKLEDGSVASKWNKLGKGSLTCADGHFYCYAEEDGTAALVEASRAGWKEKGRFTVPKASALERPSLSPSNVWAHPVVANGRLYLRDQECLFCYDVQGGARP
jgi:outer membrane protein assembly factor BamB